MKFFMSLKGERTVTNISQCGNNKKFCHSLTRSKREKHQQGDKKRQWWLQLNLGEIETDHEGVVNFSHGKLFVWK